MIQAQSSLFVTDNSGVRRILCIRVLGGNKKYARVGDIIIGVVKEACYRPEGHVENKDDCDDEDPTINPDAIEYCDDIDSSFIITSS